MENKNIDNMLASILSNDKEAFTTAFRAEIGQRIGSNVADKSLDISKDILNNNDESNDESKESLEEAKNTRYKFKSSSDAKKFADEASKTPGLIGVNKRNFSVRGKEVLISGIKDKDTLQMLIMLAKEMNAQ